jgi:hypothetical protein
VLFNDIYVGGFGSRQAVTATFAIVDSGIAVDPAACADGVLDANGCCYRETGAVGGDAGFTFNPDGGFSFDGGFNFDGGFSFDGGGFAGPAPSAGTLTLSDDGRQLGLPMTPVSGAYVSQTATWSPGDSLGVSASGAEVHAFATTVAAPTNASITSPALGGFSAAPISTTTALVVTWTGSGNKALVILSNQNLSKTLTCYGDNDGRRTIGSATLSQYFASESGNYGFLGVGVGNVATANSDNANVSVAADTITGGLVQFQ